MIPFVKNSGSKTNLSWQKTYTWLPGDERDWEGVVIKGYEE